MKRRRTKNISIEFDDNDNAVGWVFDVNKAFRQALDILFTERVEKAKQLDGTTKKIKKNVWTQGNPPLYSFDIGDVFYKPHGPRSMDWSEALKILQYSIQVNDSKSDDMTSDGQIVDGYVKYTLNKYEDGRIVKTLEHTVSQNKFVLMLKMFEEMI